MVILIWDDPAGFVGGIESIAVALAADHGLMADLIASLPESAKERQKIENPYSPGTGYYDEYATGWYSGYFAFQIVTIFVGGKEVLAAVKSSQKFAQLTAGIATKMDDISRALKVSGRFGISEKVGLMLMDESASSGIIPGVVGRASTVAKKTDVNQLLKKIPEGKLDAFSGHENKLADFLSLTGDDGVKLLNAMDEVRLIKLFSLSIDGVTDKRMLEFRAGLVRMHSIDVSKGDIIKYVDDVSKVTDVPNSRKFIYDMGSANSMDNFKGLSFEADRAAYYRQIGSNIEIEPIKAIDLKVGNKYIEAKASNGMINKNKLWNYLDSGQDKFGKNTEFISDNPTKLEISAREGLGEVGEQGIKDEIDYWARTEIIEIPDRKNYIGEIEIFLPDGNSVKCVRTTTGTFRWI